MLLLLLAFVSTVSLVISGAVDEPSHVGFRLRVSLDCLHVVVAVTSRHCLSLRLQLLLLSPLLHRLFVLLVVVSTAVLLVPSLW